jgi:hypothetical protein
MLVRVIEVAFRNAMIISSFSIHQRVMDEPQNPRQPFQNFSNTDATNPSHALPYVRVHSVVKLTPVI